MRKLVLGAVLLGVCLAGCGHSAPNPYATKCLRYALGVNDTHPRYFGVAECYASTRLDQSSESVQASCPARRRLGATRFQYTCSVAAPKQLRGHGPSSG